MRRREFMRKATAAGITGAAALGSTPAASAVTLDDVQGSVSCYCGCGDPLEICDCEYANKGREFIRQKINQGMGREEIIDAYVQQFTMEQAPNGPQDYPLRASAKKEGRGLSLWLIPPLGVIVGASLVYYYMKRGVGEGSGAPSAGPATGSGSCPECGADVPEGAQFCTGCGNEIGSSFCTSCGDAVNPGDQFCPNCGKSL